MPITHKIIMCSACNSDGVTTPRLIELEAFKLWRYMMEKSHNIQIDDLRLGLWIDSDSFYEREEVHARSGEVEAVDRILLSIFDAKNGFCETIMRFAKQSETAQVRQVLMSHVADSIKDAGDVDVDVLPGFCVVKHGAVNQINLGLSGL
ncbi:MAG: hypothetical protein HOM11_06910 [Methylococcales bacterium]|jgi:hypothetical protein|nr:hypothetical protein [Methylococcales bacterium]MBT7445074.1 hypothetical protein [Methylococcales bacterium]